VLERNNVKRCEACALKVLQSVSRIIARCNTPEEQTLVLRAASFRALTKPLTFRMALGARRTGTNGEGLSFIRASKKVSDETKNGGGSFTECYRRLEMISRPA